LGNGRKNNGNFAFLWIFIIMMTMGSGIFNILFGLLPLGIMGYIFYKIFFNLNVDAKKDSRYYENRKVRTRLKDRDIRKIDRKLYSFFKNNATLPLIEDISLRPKKGTFNSVNELYVYKDDEAIMSLNEFGLNHNKLYDDIMKLLLAYAENKSIKVEDQDVESYLRHTDEAVSKVENETEASSEISSARSYIDIIDNLNSQIPNEEITNGLYETTSLLKNTEILEQRYGRDGDLMHKLYDIYLPQLHKIINKYKNLQETAKGSDEFDNCEGQLSKSIILVNEAIKNINEKLHEEDYLDISTDMTTLESILKKDGLVDEGDIRNYGGKQ